MTIEEAEFIKWFSELSNKDVQIAGGKGASLGEMYNAQIPVPQGFVVTAQAYSYFIETAGIKERIREIIFGINIEDINVLNNVSEQLRKLIEKADFPEKMSSLIEEAYEILDVEKPENDENVIALLEKAKTPYVAVRSSATTEDLADASFAGQQETFLNVKEKENVLEKIKKCMSSLFTPRAIYYREKKGFTHDKSLIAVIVQKMIDSKKSGVIFSQNPVKKDKSIVIEAVFGLGEGIVSGKIKPDHYVVDKDIDNFRIMDTKVPRKKIAIIKNEQGENETISLPPEKQEEKVLNNYEIKMLAQYAKKLEEHYKKPQDIEFAISDEGIFIVQSRPITTQFKEAEEEISGEVLLSGFGASPGIAYGIVKIVHSAEDLARVKENDVLVTEMTNPDMVVTMQKAAAIITDEGGITSHAAIVSREMGIPAVVGTENATLKLKDGDVVTVDGSAGVVFSGKGKTKIAEVLPVVKTKTQIKVIVDIPASAERAAKSQAKSVGLTRLEGIIATGGKHPIKFVEDKKIEGYVKLLLDGMRKIAEYFEEMWIRTSDIRSDEYRNLEGAPKEIEGNPMLGDHGIRFSLKHREILKAEFQAVKKLAEEFPNKKFGVMIPQLISLDELKEAKSIAQKISLPKNIEMGIMVETPAAVQIIEDLCNEGIDFISFGTNDLTQYTLAVDRNNESVQDIFNEMSAAVLNSLSYVIRKCKKYNVKTSICGQAGSNPEMVKFLVEHGIGSISVNADAAQKISQLVAKIENLISSQQKENLKIHESAPSDEKPEPEFQPEPHTDMPEEEREPKISQQPFDVPPEEVYDEQSAYKEKPSFHDPFLKDPGQEFSSYNTYESPEKEDSEDIEDAVLKALEDDGINQLLDKPKKEDIPPLDDSIPSDSESFVSENNETKNEIDLDDNLGDEWEDGEK